MSFIRSTSVVCFVLVQACSSTSRAPSSDDPYETGKKIGALFEQVTPLDKGKARRPVFEKDHGCVKATFAVNPEINADLKVGAFAGTSYPAWIRFSNDGPARSDQNKGARGMAVKLLGVPGKKILEGEEDSDTQDFVMQNYPIFFTRTASDFLDFTASALSGDREQFRKYNETHPETGRVLGEIDQQLLADPLDGQYWTPTPYKIGSGAMKYMVKPCKTPAEPSTKPMTGAGYLRRNLITHLKKKDACFGFWVQLQKDPVKMPIDDATVLWNEAESPFQQVGTITVAKGQDIDDPVRKTECENLSFTGWHALPEHEPLGSINQARKIVYKHIADLRRRQNSVPIAEPKTVTE